MNRKVCTNGTQNRISVGGFIQNPPNGILLAQEGYVFYQRNLTIAPIVNGDYQLNIDQPLVVPPGFVLEIEQIAIESIPTNSGEPAATCGYMVLAALASLFQAGQSVAFDLGLAGAGITNPASFGPGVVAGPGGLVHIWGGSVFMRPGTPAVVLAPVLTQSPTNDLPKCYPSTIAESDQTSSGGQLLLQARKYVIGGLAIYFCIFATPFQSHPITTLICLQGKLITDDKYLRAAE